MKDKKRMATKGRPDEWAFKNLKVMTQEHKAMLGKHLIVLGYKLVKDKGGKTIDDVKEDIDNVYVQLEKLKQHYDK